MRRHLMKTMRREAWRLNSGMRMLLLALAAIGLLGLVAACGGDDEAEVSVSAAPTATATTAAPLAPGEPTPTPTTIPPTPTPKPIPTATPTPMGDRPLSGGIWNSYSNPPNHPDPYHAAGGGGSTWGPLVFNSLIEIRYPFDPAEGLVYEGGLATDWVADSSGKWTFTLRQGVKWHDGAPFTADDVVATFNRVLDPEVIIHGRGPLGLRAILSSVSKVDDHTVIVDFGEPTSAAFAFLSSYMIPIEPAHIITGPDPKSANADLRWTWMHPDSSVGSGTMAIGTGPFKMIDWQADQRMELVKNPDYFKTDEYGVQLPYMDAVIWEERLDNTKVLARFITATDTYTTGAGAGMHDRDATSLCGKTNGGLDGCYTLPFPHGYFSVVLNHNLPIFQDPRIIKAVRYSMNMDFVLTQAYGAGQGYMWMDRGRFPDTALTLEEQYELLPWSNPDRRAEYIQKSKDLLAEAGYPNGLDLDLGIYSDGLCRGSFLDQYSLMVEELRAVGINGILQCREGIVQQDDERAGRFSIDGPGDSISLVDPSNSLFLQALSTSPQVGEAPWKWLGQQEVDDRYFAAVATVDDASRASQFKDIEKFLADDTLTVFPVGYSWVTLAVQGCIRDYRPGGVWASHGFALERVWMEEECQAKFSK